MSKVKATKAAKQASNQTTQAIVPATPAPAEPQVNTWAQLAAPAAALAAQNAAPAQAKAGSQYNHYVLGTKAPGPRTSGAQGQASNTQQAWQACAACISANNGSATGAQLAAALQAVGLQFKTYVPYFTNRCHWLALGPKQPEQPALIVLGQHPVATGA